jgi:protein translocase SecG subunit
MGLDHAGKFQPEKNHVPPRRPEPCAHDNDAGDFVVVALFMVIFILLQEGKGGGRVFQGSTAISCFGAGNPLRRITAVSAALFARLAGYLSVAWSTV